MIPVKLQLSGFLSYRDTVEVDFTSFHLACISGHNGAGKSSLLDAITWALFGEARKPGEALINAASDSAQVVFTFDYEGHRYRIQRILPRGKATLLEFAIADGDSRWRPLTEKSVRATQERIRTILRLDHETFVNASFFLQGKADQFASASPADRKRILANILGLEAWDAYRERAAEQRKTIEREIDSIHGRLAEINEELAQETARQSRLKDLEKDLARLAEQRKTHETLLKNVEKMTALLALQRQQAEEARRGLERLRREQTALQTRLAGRETERTSRQTLLERSAQIQAAYAAWQKARADLESIETLAGRFREQEKARQPHLDALHTEQARLEQEHQTLQRQAALSAQHTQNLTQLESDLAAAQSALEAIEAAQTRRETLRARLEEIRAHMAALKAENDTLKQAMNPLDKRIKELESAEGAACPLCGQSLTPEHRAATLEQIRAEGTHLGDTWRDNKFRLEAYAVELTQVESELKPLAAVDAERSRHIALVSQLTQKRESLQTDLQHWQQTGQPRLAEIETALVHQTFSAAPRAALSALDAELAAMGYDPAAHHSLRAAEAEGRAAEAESIALQTAQAALAPLNDEIANLQSQITNLQAELATQEAAYAQIAAALTAAEAETPDLHRAEDELLRLQEQENIHQREVGAARQLVNVLGQRRAQKQQYESEREALALQIARHKMLERAFGKDGVPALLIEQAIPQIEEKANELLDRLSNGTMAVRFITQSAYKDKKRDDLKETLEIIISDSSGPRDYEMFSGGEAFRVNFAIRLALSEILARRTGARLQTLVIDEGFGSQDTLGIQRLVEAINIVSRDFAKILIITHLDELKEAFPNRIDVEKTARGSTVRVL